MNVKQQTWQAWVEKNQENFGECAHDFCKKAQLVDVKQNEVTFTIEDKNVTFTKNSEFSWLMPSSLFVPYGSLSDIYPGLKLLLEENHTDQ